MTREEAKECAGRSNADPRLQADWSAFASDRHGGEWHVYYRHKSSSLRVSLFGIHTPDEALTELADSLHLYYGGQP